MEAEVGIEGSWGKDRGKLGQGQREARGKDRGKHGVKVEGSKSEDRRKQRRR